MSTTPHPNDWDQVIAHLSDKNGVVLLLGGIDSGKTSFCIKLSNYRANLGLETSIIDADVGQSEIGPPGTIGYGIVKNKIDNLGDVKVRELFFYGANSPSKLASRYLFGLNSLLRFTNQESLMIVDTAGINFSNVGIHLSLSIIEAVNPNYIVMLQKTIELENIIKKLELSERWKILRVSSPGEFSKRPSIFRQNRRKSKLLLALEQSNLHTVDFGNVILMGTLFGLGERLTSSQLIDINNLLQNGSVFGESYGKHLILVGSAPKQAVSNVFYKQFKIQKLSILDNNHFDNYFVGLTDFEGKTYAVGVVANIDFASSKIYIYSKAHSLESVRWINFGIMRVSLDGRELTEGKPWKSDYNYSV